jgi:hypothetical protein
MSRARSTTALSYTVLSTSSLITALIVVFDSVLTVVPAVVPAAAPISILVDVIMGFSVVDFEVIIVAVDIQGLWGIPR